MAGPKPIPQPSQPESAKNSVFTGFFCCGMAGMAGMAENNNVVAESKMSERQSYIFDRIRNAMNRADETYPGRINWATDSDAAREAENDLNETIASYLKGTKNVEQVQEAFRRWIRALIIQKQPPACEPKQMELIQT